jgi:hypothetical protein
MSDPPRNELESPVEKLEKGKRFWKRLALAQSVVLVLLLVMLGGFSLNMIALARQNLDRARQAQMMAEENLRLADEAARRANELQKAKQRGNPND